MLKTITFFLFIVQICFAQERQFSEFSYQCTDDVARPYIVYTPQNLDEGSPKPLLIYLHGAISNPNLKADPLEYISKSKLIQLADEVGMYLLFSYGQKGATWFDSVGVDMVKGEVKESIDNFNIDENKIFLGGFSDGGSGALYFAVNQPELFAGFIAMNGSLKVAEKIGDDALYLENSNQRPIYIINTQNDMLYDIKEIEPTVHYFKKFNSNIIFNDPKGNHEMSYLQDETRHLKKFIHHTTRTNLKEISWECSSHSKNNFDDIISILNIDTISAPERWHQPYSLEVYNDNADFGLTYDYSFQGKGLKVNGFKNDTSSAKKMGVEIDDIVIKMEEDSIESPYSPYFYISKKKAGDSTSLTVIRNKEELEIHGKFNEGFFYQVFRQKEETGKFIAKIDHQKLIISTSKIKELRINFDKLKKYNIENLEINGKNIKSNLKGEQIITIQ